MAITVISRPQGHKLDTEQFSAVITDDGTGTAVVYVAGGHGMQDGDWVYIESNFDRYNGFKYIDSTAYDHFEIKNSSEESPIEFIQEADITFYRSVLDHGFCCVHLPIVYELESSLYPANIEEEEYTPRTVVSQADNSGYTQLNLSSALGDIDALDWIELVGDGELSGPYQIIEVLHQWSVVINLAYNASNVFTGYQVVNYYNNYHIKVQVYAGLSSAHRWEDQKPYELAATLQFIPDSNNRVKFSISEILKGYIETRNNLTLDTLPNNLDFYVQFYVRYSENYDSSDDETISVSEGAYISDQSNLEGHAVNAKLPFKSQNAGYLSDYVDDGEGTILARWLTLQDRPLMVTGYFFDLSFINRLNNVDIHISVYKKLNGSLIESEIIEIENPGSGILRVPIIPEIGFDEYCLIASTPGRPATSDQPPTLDGLASWINATGTHAGDWALSSTPDNSANAGNSTGYVVGGFIGMAGEEYNFDISFRVFGAGPNPTATEVTIALLDSSFNELDTAVFNYTGTGTENENISLIPSGNSAYFGIRIQNNTTIDSKSYEVLSASFNASEWTDDSVAAHTITEQICCDVVEECNTFVNDSLRLTEGGQFRELE